MSSPKRGERTYRVKFPLSLSGNRIIFTSFVIDSFLKYHVDVHVYVDTNDSAVFEFWQYFTIGRPRCQGGRVFFGGQQQTVVDFGQILPHCHSLVLEVFAVWHHQVPGPPGKESHDDGPASSLGWRWSNAMSHVNVGFRDLHPDILGKHLGTLLNAAVCGLPLLLWHFVYPTVPSSQILLMVILVTPQLPVFFVVLVYSVLEIFVVFLDLF